MYLFLGHETVVRTEDIVGMFDLDKASTSAITKRFLNIAQKQGQIVDVSPGELPVSFVVCQRKDVSRVYLTQISVGTLKKRLSGIRLADF